MATSYPDNLTREQFELLAPLLPAAKPGSRHREVDLWEVLNAIFYILTNGCQWRALAKDFPKWQTVSQLASRWHLAADSRPTTRVDPGERPPRSQSIRVNHR